eukprot:Rhum_TRINITY_DN14888_c2_g3::Rhum_TRINITY_DN14888_c2_g3_i3::g.124996::m.124996
MRDDSCDAASCTSGGNAPASMSCCKVPSSPCRMTIETTHAASCCKSTCSLLRQATSLGSTGGCAPSRVATRCSLGSVSNCIRSSVTAWSSSASLPNLMASAVRRRCRGVPVLATTVTRSPIWRPVPLSGMSSSSSTVPSGPATRSSAATPSPQREPARGFVFLFRFLPSFFVTFFVAFFGTFFLVFSSFCSRSSSAGARTSRAAKTAAWTAACICPTVASGSTVTQRSSPQRSGYRSIAGARRSYSPAEDGWGGEVAIVTNSVFGAGGDGGGGRSGCSPLLLQQARRAPALPAWSLEAAQWRGTHVLTFRNSSHR